MNRITALLVALAVGVLTLTPWTWAQAATVKPVPRCIATAWASQHYHQPKTPRGTTCVVHGKSGPAYGSVGYGGATVTAFTPDWYPSSWPSVGLTTNAAGDVTGLIVRRPR
jgi:hypothetical protein